MTDSLISKWFYNEWNSSEGLDYCKHAQSGGDHSTGKLNVPEVKVDEASNSTWYKPALRETDVRRWTSET